MPDSPVYTAGNIRGALLALLPPGAVWPRDLDGVVTRVMGGLSTLYAGVTARAAALLQDSPTGTLNERLPDWEASLGLPDLCAGLNPTLDQRRRSVRAAIAARGGQTVPYVQALLAALGRTGTVTECAPSRMGVFEMGDPLGGPEWAHAWQVVVDPPPYGLEDTVAIDAVVTCVLQRMQPADTVLLVSFETPGDFDPADLFGGDLYGGAT